MTNTTGELRRTLGLADSVVIGLGSMIGAGVYSVWSAASRSSGSLVLAGLAIAAVVASINALASARLAALHPRSGGTYIYGRERLGPVWGFTAGWGFVVGKTASCAAMASTVGAYVLPNHSRSIALASIALITAVNIGGLQRTVAVTRILLVVAAVVLSIVIVSAWSRPGFRPAAALPWSEEAHRSSAGGAIYDVIQSAGLLFFAFAGYARIATLGEEVQDPQRTIPRAMALSLAGVLVLYVAVGFTVLGSLAPATLAATSDPLRAVVALGKFDNSAPIVRVGATIAALGALLNLLPGVSRTAMAMARNGDLPRYFAHVDVRRSLPVRAEITIACTAALVVVVFDLRSAIGLSGVGVLTYYAITNASAATLASKRRAKLVPWFGVSACCVLVLSLPPGILLTGSSVLATGLVLRRILRRSVRSPE